MFLLFPPTVSTVMRSVARESELVAAMTSEAAIEQLPPGTTLEGSKERLSVECRVDHVGCVDIEFKNNQASVFFLFFFCHWQGKFMFHAKLASQSLLSSLNLKLAEKPGTMQPGSWLVFEQCH